MFISPPALPHNVHKGAQPFCYGVCVCVCPRQLSAAIVPPQEDESIRSWSSSPSQRMTKDWGAVHLKGGRKRRSRSRSSSRSSSTTTRRSSSSPSLREKKEKRKKKKMKKEKMKKKKEKKMKKKNKEKVGGEEVTDRILRSPMPAADHMLKGFVDLFENALAKNPGKGAFIEFYGGEGKVSARAEKKYGLIGICIDYQAHSAWNLHTEGVMPYIAEKVSNGKVKAGHVATECKTFSSARHGKAGTNLPKPLRDYGENAWGYPDLCEQDRLKLELGNKDARLTLQLIDLFLQHDVPISVENGHSSILWHLPEIKKRLQNARIFKVDYCMMGRDYRKRTRLAAWALKNNHLADQIVKQCRQKYTCLSKKSICCRTRRPHLLLRGWTRGKFQGPAGKQVVGVDRWLVSTW